MSYYYYACLISITTPVLARPRPHIHKSEMKAPQAKVLSAAGQFPSAAGHLISAAGRFFSAPQAKVCNAAGRIVCAAGQLF
jgi:hypothetical protein